MATHMQDFISDLPPPGGPYPPIARDSDIGTSHEAASEITASGKRQTYMGMCLETVGRYPGLTAGHIGEVTGLGHGRVWRRLSDLKNQGKIYQGPSEMWHGRKQCTWWPVREEKQLELL